MAPDFQIRCAGVWAARMNYRHAFHAGNHCDVLKHAALALVLERLQSKEKPFAVLDTHAGRGLYDLSSEEAIRSGEFGAGIVRLIGDTGAPSSLQPYLRAVSACNPFGGDLRWYPGSPLIIQAALREGDSAKFCELHPAERQALESAIGKDARVKIFERDGYEAVRAFLPPKERRGLVLVDPPFEQPGEYARLAGVVADGVERWASGIFLIWRPIKDEAGHAGFLAAVERLGLKKTLVAELSVAPRRKDTLTGSGLFVINPPYGLAKALTELLPYLANRLAATPGGGWRIVEQEGGAVTEKAGVSS